MIMYSVQKTLAQDVHLEGRGVHSNLPVRLTLKPAVEDSGITFFRADLEKDNQIPVSIEAVVDTRSCTILTNSQGTKLATVEHLMAALCGLGVSNCAVYVSGGEMPILDGCSEAFINAINAAGGLKEQTKKQKHLKVLKKVMVEEAGRWISLEPSTDDSLRFEMTHDYQGREGIGAFTMSYEHNTQSFEREIAKARTFGFFADAEKLWSMGLALGSSLENSVVFRDGHPMNEEGLRFENEMVRHKILDSLGDFYLTGMPLIAQVKGYNCGHGLNNQVMRKLLGSQENFEVTEA